MNRRQFLGTLGTAACVTLLPKPRLGKISLGGRAYVLWRGRLVGLPWKPQETWLVSKVGDPTSWSYSPVPA